MVDTKAKTINRLRYSLRQYTSWEGTKNSALNDLQSREIHGEGQAHRKEREQP